MIIRYFYQFLFTLLYPFFLLMPLAFGAMTVPATVIADMNMPALRIGTFIDMPSQLGCPANFYGIQSSILPTIEGKFPQLMVIASQHISHFV
jgi:hypothetical protein